MASLPVNAALPVMVSSGLLPHPWFLCASFCEHIGQTLLPQSGTLLLHFQVNLLQELQMILAEEGTYQAKLPYSAGRHVPLVLVDEHLQQSMRPQLPLEGSYLIGVGDNKASLKEVRHDNLLNSNERSSSQCQTQEGWVE